ncbi:hypothetical protein ACIBI8_19425 [Streptomyces sp. NPDC050529]|uniref:hypothetical protein n=1 Tax=unclassified Streptomyces TaxID=2593676 RepID=UPI002DD80D7A|nr:hypothetical protein [Streptomyces sp. NBC_01022]WRZ82074.1 hypothetical protein OG316_18300 [Streptomyces sp. NBC_01022]
MAVSARDRCAIGSARDWKAFKIWRALKKADKLVKEAEDLVRAAEASAKAASSQVKAIESAAAACTKHSFKGDTHVLLADGTTKPIADLRQGDEVTSTDPQTEVTAAEKVERRIITKDDKEFTDLVLTPGPATSRAAGPVAAPGDAPRPRPRGTTRSGTPRTTAGPTPGT